MFKVISKQELVKDITKLIIEAPEIAKKAKAGQFVVVIIDEQGERIPLTISNWDKEKGTICLIFQKIGFTTKKLGLLNPGDNIQHILGPLGHPTEINPSTALRVDGEQSRTINPSTTLKDYGERSRTINPSTTLKDYGEQSRTIKKFGTIFCIGGGVGIAEVYPVARAFKESGNRLIGIIGARFKDLLILEKEMQEICDELFITTDDGSYGRRGLVTDILKELLVTIEKSTHTLYPNLVYAIGPVLMMQAVSELTRPYKIKTIVSLNPIMLDATGMCGTCRCSVGGKTVFGCVDGPDFDGHQVYFDELQNRLKLFVKQEEIINEKFAT